MNVVIVRLCKAALVLTIAAYFTLISVNNLTDYNTNFLFVKHVMSMDTVFPESKTVWHDIDSEFMHHLVYASIILWELFTAFLCWFAGIQLFISRHNPVKFHKNKTLAFLALAAGLFLYIVGFVTIGGEWFQMWQSKIWNAQTQSELAINMIGIIILIILSPE